MTHFKIASALIISLSVAACGGASDTSGTSTGTPPAVSRIFDVTFPEGDDFAARTSSAQATIDAFDTRNRMAVASTLPDGNGVYLGSTAIGVGSGDAASVVEGEIVLFVNFDTMFLNGQFQNLSIDDLDGTVTPISDPIRISTAPIVSGRYLTTVSNDPFSVGGETARFDAKVDGAFVENGAGTIGVIDGSVTIGSAPSQSLAGVFSADKQ